MVNFTDSQVNQGQENKVLMEWNEARVDKEGEMRATKRDIYSDVGMTVYTVL
jgi:hypothetical protein